MPLVFLYHPCNILKMDTPVLKSLSLEQISQEKIAILEHVEKKSSKTTCHQTITKYGLLTPLLVQESDCDHFLLLAGNFFWTAAQQAQLDTVPCLILSKNISTLDTCSFIILYRQDYQKKSPVDDALLLMDATKKLPQESIFQLLGLMGYPQNSHTLAKIVGLLQLAPSLLPLIHNNTVPVKTANKICYLPRQDQNLLSTLIEKYQIKGSKQKKLVDLTIELLRRKKVSLEFLLSDWQPSKKDQKNIPQQGFQLLTFLQKMSTPHLVQAKEDFHAFLQTLKLPAEITISHSQSFEKDALQVCMEFKNRQHLLTYWDTITSIFSSSTKDQDNA